MRLRAATVIVLAVVACTNDEAPPADPAAPSGAAPGAATAPAPAATVEPGYVTQSLGLRRVPDEAQKIDDPAAPGKKIANWLTTLQRGEEVSILAREGDWVKVRASDDTEGWLKGKAVLNAIESRPATSALELMTFKRPDLNTPIAGKKLEPGLLFFVTKTKDQFSEIDTGDVWVLSEKLLTDAKEVGAARMLAKIRAGRAKNEPGIDDLVALFNGQFGETQIAKLLDVPGPAASGPEGAPAAPAGEPSPH